jgi:putative tricarboxylic transport membrane protein
LVWALIASLYLGNIMLLVLNLPLVGLWARLLLIPRPLLYGGILVLSMLGVYSLKNSVFDLWLLLGIGVLGFGMRQFEYPVAPLVVGLILGPMAEEQFRRAYAIAQGDVSVFVTQPISAALLILAISCVVGPFLLKKRKAAHH